MYKQPSPRNSILRLLFMLLLGIPWQTGIALTSDEKQPIEIEADSAELDDLNNVSVYRGDVIATQGSIRMTGDIMTVHFTDDNDMEILVMEGTPAHYRQLPDSSDVYDEAEALTMEYYELKNMVVLIEEAVVTQERAGFSGNRIEYDTILNKVNAWSDPDTEDSTNTAIEPKKKQRVKIIIKPKED
jgi:lipopolysaccharide export system protein LptA